MDNNYWVEDTGVVAPSPGKIRKRRAVKRKFEFVGWGSKPLIEFLESIGKDPREKPTQRQVAAYITTYVNENGLASAEKKKKVLCDDRLHALFGKKSVSRPKVYDMLEEHFAENQDDSDDELDSSEDEGCGRSTSLLLQRNRSSLTKKVQKAPKSCFAAVTSGNIKLIYLKRCVIQDLLKERDSFEFKMVGSFVRMKSDPNDIYQKNRFQLQQVTGVEKVPGAGDDGVEILLRVSNFFKDVPISMLSDDNFSEEEVEDVQGRIKSGLLKRLTLKAVEEKARILHADITKHWIARELTSLQHKIDHANEKGWRRELFDYLDRRKMLQTPSECEKLLLNIPEVIAEKLEPEVTAATAISEKEEGNGGSPKSILRASSDVSSAEVLVPGSGGVVAPSQVIPSDSHAPEPPKETIDTLPIFISVPGSGGVVAPSQVIPSNSHAPEPPSETIDATLPINGYGGTVAPSQVIPIEPPSETIDATLPIIGEKPSEKQLPPVADEGIKSTEFVASEGNNEPMQKQANAAVVIDLLSDDEEEKVPMVNDQTSGGELPPNNDQWYYLDPQGQTQGPFSVRLLKIWSDACYFCPDFRVWNSTQTSCQGEGVLLTDVLSQSFPN